MGGERLSNLTIWSPFAGAASGTGGRHTPPPFDASSCRPHDLQRAGGRTRTRLRLHAPARSRGTCSAPTGCSLTSRTPTDRLSPGPLPHPLRPADARQARSRQDMSDRDNIQSLLALRKLTRAITDVVRVQMTDYLRTLTPLMRPQAVLGEYVQGGHKDAAKKADKAFKDLQALYESVAPTKPFHLQRELNTPLDFPRVGLEITPLDYVHVAQPDNRRIKVRCPLTWVLTYTDFPS